MTAEAATPGSGNAPNWQKLVSERLPQFGHRNWIVIADSAYPAPSAPGIELVISDADQMTVLRGVMGILSHAKHVKPVAYVDQELEFLEERDAPGIDLYRQQLNAMLMGNPPQPLPHIQLIEKLDQVSHLFRVLVIKTNMDASLYHCPFCSWIARIGRRTPRSACASA